MERILNCWRDNEDGTLVCEPYAKDRIVNIRYGISSYTVVPSWVPRNMIGIFLRFRHGCLKYRSVSENE